MQPKYNQLAFALQILNLLSESLKHRQELVIDLQAFLEVGGNSEDDIPQKLTRTIRKLRDCGFEIRSAPNRPYELLESNFPVILAPAKSHELRHPNGMNFGTEIA